MINTSPTWATNIIHTCMGMQAGEKVLIAVDEPLGFVRDALQAEALKANPAELWTYTIPDAVRPFSEFPPRMRDLIGQVDVAVRFLSTVDPVKEGSAHQLTYPSWRPCARARCAMDLAPISMAISWTMN